MLTTADLARSIQHDMPVVVAAMLGSDSPFMLDSFEAIYDEFFRTSSTSSYLFYLCVCSCLWLLLHARFSGTLMAAINI